jgi:mono/diheme cytochrome c family protein
MAHCERVALLVLTVASLGAEACKRNEPSAATTADSAAPAASSVAAPSAVPSLATLLAPEERGREIFASKGCNGCHSVDGACSSAGTMQGLFGTMVTLADGTDVVADDDFFRESLLNPNAKIAAESANPSPMPAYDLPANDVDALIAYVKTLDAPMDTAAPAIDASAKPSPPRPVVSGHRVRAPRFPSCETSVNGRLPAAVIQRIVKANFRRFRLCYEAGLRNNPNLAGRVSVKFVIDRKGAVALTADGGSDLPDGGVVSCVVRGFGNLSFPEPEGGMVTVVYPIVFTPDGPKK